MAGFNHFPKIASALEPVIAAVVSKAALDVQAQAASNAPVRTGFLKNSIHIENGDDDLSKNVVVGANYGIYVEMGTRYMAAQPYFYPAVETVRPQFEAALSKIEPGLAGSIG